MRNLKAGTKNINKKQKELYDAGKEDIQTIEARTVEIDGIQLSLPEVSLYKNVQVCPLFYKWEYNAYQFMLYHVAANFDRGGVETIVISADNVYNLPALSKDEAKKKMENILSL